MQPLKENISSFFAQYSPEPIQELSQLPQSGGDRIYFRIRTLSNSYILTYNTNVKENLVFFYFTQQFRKIGSPVPEILFRSEDGMYYIQQDLGINSLLAILEKEGFSESVFRLFQQSLKQLARLQILGDREIDYDRCLTSSEFGKQAILSDFLYFKYYFLDVLHIPYDKEKLLIDFEHLSTFMTSQDYKYFLFRDFQSRNIMVKDEEIFFIDYQGGMRGALQYDVASVLWQAKANLPADWKSKLLAHYMDCADELLPQPLDRQLFIRQYHLFVLIRLLQVLGAYGFRGLFERRAHFLTSIPLALKNLKWFVDHHTIDQHIPELKRILGLITEPEIVNQFQPIQADEHTQLIVKINSFSYKKRGYPADETDNGGGFVFDCRGILNPGRLPQFKELTGRDKEVMEFLEQQTKMPEFLNSVYDVVGISVEDYLKRNFTSLMINFGCTGGQHRSVYAAESVARFLRNKYHVKIELAHLEQNIFERKGF